jgi:hypothetical protein
VASFGMIRSLLSINSCPPANFNLWGVEHFVLDGVVDKVAFEPPPVHFASFLVGEPKAFPCIVQLCLQSRMGISMVLVMVESSVSHMSHMSHMLDSGRKVRKERLPKRGWQDVQNTAQGNRKQERKF